MFCNAPIVCHHDFGQCSLDEDAFRDVEFVHPHLHTGWGTMSTVEAIIAAMRMLYARPDAPEWVVLLSGADYPIKPAQRILEDLRCSDADAHIDLHRIDSSGIDDPWVRGKFLRYFAIRLRIPYWSRELGRPSTRWKRVTSKYIPLLHRVCPWLNRPFSRTFHCYCGNTWFSVNRRVAKEILRFHNEQPSLAKQYAWKGNVDESYIHCILGNAKSLRISTAPLRYMDWSKGGKSMRTLTIADLPTLQASTAHFARKFDPQIDSKVLDELDRMIL